MVLSNANATVRQRVMENSVLSHGLLAPRITRWAEGDAGKQREAGEQATNGGLKAVLFVKDDDLDSVSPLAFHHSYG